MNLRHVRWLSLTVAIAAAHGCATASSRTASAPRAADPRTAVRLEPAAATQSGAPSSALPPIATPTSDAIADRASGPRVASLTAVDQELSTVVRELAGRFGLQYQIDPSVRGRVNTTIRNKTLPEALDAIIPNGMSYQIEGGVLRVGPARLATRIFSLDYVAISRVGTASTIIQRRLGNASINTPTGIGAGGTAPLGAQYNQFGGGIGAGADVISSVSIADAWEEIRVALEALIFDTPTATPQTAIQPQYSSGLGLGIGSAGRPYSRVGTDGRRLIINPMAGTITVTAVSSELGNVDTFIRAFESSIQRQVLIEAKIVEVNLDRSFEFGIDWNVLARAGTGNVQLRSTTTPRSTGNVQFTLSGGSGEISVVLNALSSQGDVRVLSSPRVSALNNQRAVFDVTTGEIVFNVTQTFLTNTTGGNPTPITQVTPQQVNVGIVLDVLPQIGADNTVTMNIRPVVTSVARTATFNGADGQIFQAPVIDTRESDTMARLRAGETIIIGGLMQTRRETVRSGVPGLRSLPLLGRLFTTEREVERKAELVIFLTPTIISGQPTTR